MKRVWQNVVGQWMIALSVFTLIGGSAQAQITVVNMMPNAQSGETHQDSEPHLAVNTADYQLIAASAFTPDPVAGPNAPIYVSTNGGNTWVLNSIVPSQAGSSSGTGDITLSFAGPSKVLYAGILRLPGNLWMNILRTASATGSSAMTPLVDRYNVDQPFIHAETALGGSGSGKDRVYVGNNDFAAASGRTATIDRSLDAATAAPPAGFQTFRLETRATPGQDNPQIRPAVHLNGTTYVIFYGRRSVSGVIRNCDVVVVRDDNWGAGTTPFRDLLDPPAPAGDGLAGLRVVRNRAIPWQMPGLGQERLGGSLSIAVDPRDSDTIYIAWADRVSTTDYTLHVRHSTDAGVTWDANDLRAITDAINPALAINSRGRVGFLYQQLTGTAPNQQWETHFETTDNAFTTVNNQTLARFPDGTPARQFFPYLGDYAHLMAVGKNFCGVFSSSNTPDNSNFPNGVTYQRNANFTTHTLLATDKKTPVNASIDPFFFKVTGLEDDDDFYVSDWTDSPASRDMGQEPSSHPVFYTTSDVWNRRSNTPGGFNTNNQPQSEDPQMVAAGKNYAFARVRRNASGSTATVNAHFLFSEFGTGSNYQNAGTTADPTINFAATDLEKTMTSGYEWELPVTTSHHTCLAVEISTTTDPIVAPSVLGHAPGWPTTDLMFINDNNKAQRNMGVYAVGGTGEVSFYAVVHNAATYVRDLVLANEAAPKVREILKRLEVEVLGGKPPRPIGNRLILENMQPGENRWVQLTFEVPRGNEGNILPVIFNEIEGNNILNGFAIAAQPSPLPKVMRANLEFHSQVLARMAAIYDITEARQESLKAFQLSRNDKISSEVYRRFLGTGAETLQRYIEKATISAARNDPFDTERTFKLLSEHLRSQKTENVVPAHTTILHKVDALLTMHQKAKGDPADILQNVYWQKVLYATVPELKGMRAGRTVLDRSRTYIAGYESRRLGNDDYPELIRNLMDSFQSTAKTLASHDLQLEKDITEMHENLGSPAALQKAHRGFLVKLQSLRKELKKP